MGISEVLSQSLLYVTIALTTYIFIRLLRKEQTSKYTMIVLGSGGHTREMSAILRQVKPKNPVFLVAETDSTSEPLILREYPDAHFIKIPRAREVLQSYSSSIWSTAKAFWGVIGICNYYKPRLLIANGPGTAFPVIIVCRIMTFLRNFDCRIIFFESYCRIFSKSTTGKLCWPFVDRYVSHWDELGFPKYENQLTVHEKYVTVKMFPE